MRKDRYIQVKKAFLYSLVVSVTLSAILGMAAIVLGRFGWIEVRIILTTVTIAGASIAGLACGACLEHGSNRLLPVPGIVFASIAALLIIVGLWVEVDSEAYWKTTMCVSVFGVACAHLSLLSMARLAEQFRWAFPAALVIILGVASLVSAFVIFEVSDSMAYRFLGVVAIADGAITVLIPIFHRLSRSSWTPRPEVDLDALDHEIADLQERLAGLQELRRSYLARQPLTVAIKHTASTGSTVQSQLS